MDGLALLCNLYADGAVSLRRLRESGIRSLGSSSTFTLFWHFSISGED